MGKALTTLRLMNKTIRLASVDQLGITSNQWRQKQDFIRLFREELVRYLKEKVAFCVKILK